MVSVRLWTSPWWVAAHFHQRLLCLGFSLTPYKVSITVCLSWAAHKQNSGRDEAQIPSGCKPKKQYCTAAECWKVAVCGFEVHCLNNQFNFKRWEPSICLPVRGTICQVEDEMNPSLQSSTWWREVLNVKRFGKERHIMHWNVLL